LRSVPSLEEAANAFARNLVSLNVPAAMAAFTPEGMAKMMALQGQLIAQTQGSAPGVATAAGSTPPQPGATDYEIAVEEPEGEEHRVRMTFRGPMGSGVFLTTWREVEGTWKISDVVLVELVARQASQERGEP
jgi:hypothetical protein